MDLLNLELPSAQISAQSILTLAHIGDSVFELLVRSHLCVGPPLTNRDMHRATLRYVNAVAQAQAFLKIKAMLTPEEESVFLRGRNAHVHTAPKNCDPADYHTATGLESVFGYLWLSGKKTRLTELFDQIIDS